MKFLKFFGRIILGIVMLPILILILILLCFEDVGELMWSLRA
jgi:hypothetical protein